MLAFVSCVYSEARDFDRKKDERAHLLGARGHRRRPAALGAFVALARRGSVDSL